MFTATSATPPTVSWCDGLVATLLPESSAGHQPEGAETTDFLMCTRLHSTSQYTFESTFVVRI
jgi:hypothetical protein